jgi:hypothetical protein
MVNAAPALLAAACTCLMQAVQVFGSSMVPADPLHHDEVWCVSCAVILLSHVVWFLQHSLMCGVLARPDSGAPRQGQPLH